MLYELLNLAVKHVITAHQAQVFHYGLRKISDYASIVRDACRIKYRRVANFASRNVLEDNLPLLLFAELLEGYFAAAERACIQVGKVFIFPVNTRRHNRDLYVQGLNVLLFILTVDLNNQRRLGLGPFAHRLALQLHPFGLDRFNKLHKGIGAHYADIFLYAAGIHLAQAAPKRLLRQDIALGRIGPKPHYGCHVPHVPAFFEHEHGDNGLVRTLHTVNLIGLFPQQFKLLFLLAGGRFGNLSVVLCVYHKHCAL